ncbi:MAG: hypothetical protein JKY65_20560 [Planctomycetes bacterium]|nr:hypothetical protein [Planctomycetota bacterium]
MRSWNLDGSKGLIVEPSGAWIGAARSDGKAFELFSVLSGQRVVQLANPDVEGWGEACVSPDGKRVATTGYRRQIRIWILPPAKKR